MHSYYNVIYLNIRITERVFYSFSYFWKIKGICLSVSPQWLQYRKWGKRGQLLVVSFVITLQIRKWSSLWSTICGVYCCHPVLENPFFKKLVLKPKNPWFCQNVSKLAEFIMKFLWLLVLKVPWVLLLRLSFRQYNGY